MTELDPAGARANESGWSPAALKAEAAKKKADKKADKKAKAKARREAVKRWAADTWDFLLRNLMLWLAIAAMLASATWEWWNSARGWHELYPGSGMYAYIGAAGAIGLWFLSVRRSREDFRGADDATDEKIIARKRGNGRIWFTVAIAAFIVCVAGVLVAVASNSVRAQRVAKDSRAEYQQLLIQRNDLQSKVELNDPAVHELQLESDRKFLNALVETAKGTHGMADLDVGSGCPAPPRKFFMERLCAQANGGLDPFNGAELEGKRLEIKRDEIALENAKKDVERLRDLQAQVDGFHIKSGDETAEALGEMFSIEGGTVMGWLLFVLSAAFLYGAGWLADWVLEKIEAQRLAAKEKRTTQVKGATKI